MDRPAQIAVSCAALVLALVACGPLPEGQSLMPSTAPAAKHGRAGAGRPLIVLPRNPRYFGTVADGPAVYLTGSHTWNTFQDWGLSDPPTPFDYAAYLEFLERYGHNFIRLYVWEQAAWFPATAEKVVIWPLPYLRTGPGVALDGGPRFDLRQFNPAYFRRLRERVEAARARGIYVSVMLFNGWSIELKGEKIGNPWRGHPFNRENNVNGVDGDTDGDGEGKEVHTLVNPAITDLQKAYVRKVVETVGDLDNVLWEISNESHSGATAWQYEMIRTVKNLQAALHEQHPVGMTSMWPEPDEKNRPLLESPADWISPFADRADQYPGGPAAASGRKVIIYDTDHIWGIGGNARWVWMSFLRGMNPIFMDTYTTRTRNNLPWLARDAAGKTAAVSPAPEWDAVRKAMGYARAVADRVDLAAMRPMGELSSTGLCLAAPGKEYLVYLPARDGRLRKYARSILGSLVSERAELDLAGTQGRFDLEWIDVERGMIIPGAGVTGGDRISLQAPFAGDAMAHLTAGQLPVTRR